VTLTKKLWLDSGKIEMGGGTLSLQQGGGLGTSGYGELDLINSTLELAGPFLNEGGPLTTSASTLRLKANVLFHLGNEVSFDTYEPNGWGLLLYNNEDASSTKSLTLGTDTSNITLEPSADSLTSGFVAWYHSEENIENVSGSHDIGIEGNDTIFTINGNLTLRENATISTESGEVSLGNLALENGNISVNGGTLNLAGGSVGANGELEVGGSGTLSLQGDLTVTGTLDLEDGASLRQYS